MKDKHPDIQQRALSQAAHGEDDGVSRHDVTIDELMEELSKAIDTHSPSRANGHREQQVEASQEIPHNDLIAPEVLFPAEVNEADTREPEEWAGQPARNRLRAET